MGLDFNSNKLGCYSVQLDSSWEKCGFFLKKFFLYVILKLFTKFQYPTMPATGQKVCGGGGGLGLL